MTRRITKQQSGRALQAGRTANVKALHPCSGFTPGGASVAGAERVAGVLLQTLSAVTVKNVV